MELSIGARLGLTALCLFGVIYVYPRWKEDKTDIAAIVLFFGNIGLIAYLWVSYYI
jgi:hypothetical protein